MQRLPCRRVPGGCCAGVAPAMTLKVVAGTAHPVLASAVAEHLGLTLAACLVERFPDGEVQVELREDVRGADVYVVQPTGPPAGEHLLELLLLADACRRAGCARLTAVVPYFAYARQDRRVRGGEPVGARLVADLFGAGGFARVVAVDLHSAAIEGCFGMPLEHLSAVPLLADAVRSTVSGNAVVVTPDLGAVKLAERYARLLGLPLAIVYKQRVSGSEVRVRGLVGEVRGRAPLVVDDMISTAGTVAAATTTLLDAGCLPEITVVASHALLVGPAIERLRTLPLRALVTTDSVAMPVSVAVPAAVAVPVRAMSLAGLLGDAIRRLFADQPLGDLVAPG